MKVKKLTGFMTLVFLSAICVHAKPIKTDDISNLLIQGQNRLRVSAPSIEVAWVPEIYRDIPPLIRDEALIGSLKTPTISEPTVTYPSRLTSAKTASPWLRAIHESPILTLTTKPGKDERKVEWTLLVKDSSGKLFYEKKGKGSLPEKIIWDGFGKAAQPLDVGFDYVYSLSIVDEAGNPQRYSGKPFSIKGFRYRRQGRDVTAVAPSLIFQDDSSVKFSKDGAKVLAEIKDSLRSKFSKKVEVVTYATDEKFGLARSRAIAQYLVKTLEYAESNVESKSVALNGSKGYHHVEIIAK